IARRARSSIVPLRRWAEIRGRSGRLISFLTYISQSRYCGHRAGDLQTEIGVRDRRRPRPPLEEVDIWLERVRRLWSWRLDALAVELVRGRQERRDAREDPTGAPSADDDPSAEREDDS